MNQMHTQTIMNFRNLLLAAGLMVSVLKPSLSFAWPSDAKVQAIKHWLTPDPRALLDWQPRIAEWSVEKMMRFNESLVEDGFLDPRAAIQRNPQLLSMSIGRRRESIRYLNSVWRISRERLVEDPRLIGHYLGSAVDYMNELPKGRVAALYGMTELQRISILMSIRAVAFNLPHWRLRQAYARAEGLRCSDWVGFLRKRIGR